MLNLSTTLGPWLDQAGDDFAIATIVEASGSVPRPVGTSMLVSGSGDVLGSLSGGCVEGAVVESALEALATREPRRERFGFSREDAFAVGLTCGGELEIHIEPLAVSANDGGAQRQRGLLTLLAGYGPEAPLALVRRIDPAGSGMLLVPEPQAFRPVDYAGQLQALVGPAAAGSAAAQLQALF
ncbi:hypothetical protein D477_015219, partial [Arthrobacter crystallopoietes BAB-32]